MLHLGPAEAPDIQGFRFLKKPQRSSNERGNKSDDHQGREHTPERCDDQRRQKDRLGQKEGAPQSKFLRKGSGTDRMDPQLNEMNLVACEDPVGRP